MDDGLRPKSEVPKNFDTDRPIPPEMCLKVISGLPLTQNVRDSFYRWICEWRVQYYKKKNIQKSVTD